MASPFNTKWTPPSSVRTITTIDTHTSGEPLRIPLAGLPEVQGNTTLEKRRYFMKHYDYIRTGLLLEPRGHNEMYGAIISRSSNDPDELDVFFINTEGYSSMCGHAILAIATVAFTTDIFGKKYDLSKELILHTPAGPNYARLQYNGDGTPTAKFRNVPSFVYALDQSVEVEELGNVKYDISFGGAFYAFVQAPPLNLRLDETNASQIYATAKMIKNAISKVTTFTHPFEEDLSSFFGVIFVGKANAPEHHSRHVNVFEDNQIDRSPTGTGVSARAALLVARGELKMDESITIDSIISTTMSVKAVKRVKYGQYDAVVPEVSGAASITGRHDLYFGPEDTLSQGFALR